MWCFTHNFNTFINELLKHFVHFNVSGIVFKLYTNSGFSYLKDLSIEKRNSQVGFALCSVLLLVQSGSYLPPWGLFVPRLPLRVRSETKLRQEKGCERKRESFFWWKWQWHWAYCLVKHTQPPPHAPWPCNRGQWNLLIGSRGPDCWRGNWAETVSFCRCHTQKMGWLQSQPR